MVKCAYLVWSGLIIFSVSSRLFNAVFFFKFTRISIVDAQLDLGLIRHRI